MNHTLDSQTITTTAGDYRVDWIADELADQPYNEGFSLYAITGSSYRRPFTVDHISETDSDSDVQATIVSAIKTHARSDDHWGWQFRSGAAIVRYLKLTGHHGATVVDSDYRPIDPSVDRFDRVYGVAWAPADATDPDNYTRIALAEWQSWAQGDVFGWRVVDPQDNEIDACWGYFGYYKTVLGDDQIRYTLEEATQAAQADAADRVTAANLVGAGFVGIV
jgi:hypothetical protein